jgi:hypothetical protein
MPTHQITLNDDQLDLVRDTLRRAAEEADFNRRAAKTEPQAEAWREQRDNLIDALNQFN